MASSIWPAALKEAGERLENHWRATLKAEPRTDAFIADLSAAVLASHGEAELQALQRKYAGPQNEGWWKGAARNLLMAHTRKMPHAG